MDICRLYVVGDYFQPDLRLAEAGNAVYPKIIMTKLKANRWRMAPYLGESQDIAIELQGRFIEMGRHFHRYVATS